MSFLTSVYNWFVKEKDTGNPTKIKRTAPATRDWTDSMQINASLTKGLYHNSYPGIKLGGALAYNPIATPVFFMGFPIPTVEDSDAVEEQLQDMVLQMTDAMKQIHIQSHREGTIWIWPKFKKELVWEFIPDNVVSDIIRDVQSGDVIRIETDEELLLSIGDGKTATVRRKRQFTRTRVTVSYSGNVPSGVSNTTSRNPAGIMPIPFSNNSDGDEIRGHSDYERILTDLKNYHDIDLAESSILAKFSPKMVQTVKDVNTWVENNGFEDVADMAANLDLSTIDFIINMPDENTEFVFPERATESYRKKLQQTFHKIIEASGIPEIAWGLKTEGNMASVEENMAILMNYVKDKQDQKTQAYKDLFSASLRLMSTAQLIDFASEIEIAWNHLDSVSDKTKAEIFASFAEGINKLVNIAGATKDQIFKLWKKNYPQVTEETFEEFEAGLAGMAGHKVTTGASLEEYVTFVENNALQEQ
jgi:hypothetical protein